MVVMAVTVPMVRVLGLAVLAMALRVVMEPLQGRVVVVQRGRLSQLRQLVEMGLRAQTLTGLRSVRAAVVGVVGQKTQD